MRALLVSGGTHFPGATVVDGVRSLAALGYPVTYVSWAGPSQALADEAADVIVLGPVPVGGEGQGALLPARSTLERRMRQLRTVARRQPSRVATAVRRSERAQQAAAGADLLVAVDAQALYATWQLAQAHPHPRSVYGLAAALTIVASSS
jgi:hypothetical protein